MGAWDDKESTERSWQQAAEHFRKAKEGLGKIASGFQRNAQLEHQSNETLDHLLMNPDVIDTLPEAKLDSLRIEAEGRVKHLKAKIIRAEDQQKRLGALMPGQDAGLRDALTGVATSMVDEEIRKNEQLIELIQARKQRDAKTIPEKSPEDIAAKKIADDVRVMTATLTRLDSDCEEAVRQNPEHEAAIRLRYRKAKDAILDKS